MRRSWTRPHPQRTTPRARALPGFGAGGAGADLLGAGGAEPGVGEAFQGAALSEETVDHRGRVAAGPDGAGGRGGERPG